VLTKRCFTRGQRPRDPKSRTGRPCYTARAFGRHSFVAAKTGSASVARLESEVSVGGSLTTGWYRNICRPYAFNYSPHKIIIAIENKQVGQKKHELTRRTPQRADDRRVEQQATFHLPDTSLARCPVLAASRRCRLPHLLHFRLTRRDVFLAKMVSDISDGERQFG